MRYLWRRRLWIRSACGKYVQTKKKSILEPCPPSAGPYGKAALARVSKGLHPDTHVMGSKVESCWDCQAKREISFTSLKPAAKQLATSQARAAPGLGRRRTTRR